MPRTKTKKRGLKNTKVVELEPKTEGQRNYVDAIRNSPVTICNGLAGTGKTIIAVGMAIKFLQESPNYNRIVMVRPAITACDEDLGYLPGELSEKMAPYMTPMVDSMRYFLNDSQIDVMFKTGTVEVIPIAYMRGRTFNKCVIIFDEAQNSTPKQMKMFLTRLGESCKTIIEGDVSQSDLPPSIAQENGLSDASLRLQSLDCVEVVKLTKSDVVRSPVVSKILEMYE